MKRFLLALHTFGFALALGAVAIAQTASLLPSWNDGQAKQSILRFVAKVTNEVSPDFVSPTERIAVFDNDGTLWAEQPMYFQLLFALDRVNALASEHPEWREEEPFASLLKGDVKRALAGGEHAMLEIVMATHAGMTTEEFERTKFDMRDGKPVLVRLPEVSFIDDKEGKSIGIHSHIGRRPIAAFGNSDGDLQMLQ